MDGDLLASGGADGTVRLWELPAGRELHALTGHDDSVTGVALTRAGDRTLAGSCSLDGTVRTWDARTGEPLAARPARSDWLAAIAFSGTDDGPAVVTAATDGGVRLWAALTGDPIAVLADGPAPSAVACGRRLVAAGHKDGSLRLWSDGTLARTIPASGGAVTAVAFGPGGLICGTDEGAVRVHDLDSGEEVRTLTPHTAPVFALAFAGDLLVSGGADATVRTWDARSGVPRDRMLGHTGPVAAVAAGDAGGRTVLASAGYDRVVRTWDAASGRPPLALHGHLAPVYALAFGGGLLAIAMRSHRARGRGDELPECNPHRAVLRARARTQAAFPGCSKSSTRVRRG
ncbi:WD40 repeat domain-containing protein [Actinoallomurus sp. CA-142502]|uniref:WD40 repeat domain-containing protein n=1 Tax=Actinoallomurus sp. CA-142502 TaxID=3239885 RepID=UPI003D8AFFEA